MTEELKANRRWEAKNPDKTKHDTARRQARRYIRDFATEEDISEIKTWLELVQQRKNEEIE
ncbi:hypothetical protein QK912_11195 [Lactococcus lactis]|jgi:hypothetical protein|uniref:hypothetical protein n=1 Tax=Lactococcus lactis TaxID=1358 RepID=UPI001BA56469|nr:hypothetical protein [Lactococcus lactis]MBR8674936.1 hypothetical protein [Lactococcus lactis subsp. lactis]MBR8677751.1 hypothetical protein [Lactococcus lactis subsp. lactis]MBR8685237.1 hypothetical protein [Lactococcus lactis subsp. lactis]MCH5428558.1 hypothetical protein [Lactococcus lactis]MCT0049558.1 hypothetical protein [Lactococcus lactis subsp. lactis]